MNWTGVYYYRNTFRLLVSSTAFRRFLTSLEHRPVFVAHGYKNFKITIKSQGRAVVNIYLSSISLMIVNY